MKNLHSIRTLRGAGYFLDTFPKEAGPRQKALQRAQEIYGLFQRDA